MTLDNAFTGDWWWSSNIVDAYNDRFHPPLLNLTGLPGAVFERVGDVATWPVALLAVAALAVGLAQRPFDASSRLPGRAHPRPARRRRARADLGRRRRADAHGARGLRGRRRRRGARRAQLRAVRGSLAIIAVAAVPLAAAPWLAGAVRDVGDQARQARSLEKVVAPALEREQPDGYIALPRQWQGQLALAWDRPRSSFIPARAIGDGDEIDKCERRCADRPGRRQAAALDPPGRR